MVNYVGVDHILINAARNYTITDAENDATHHSSKRVQQQKPESHGCQRLRVISGDRTPQHGPPEHQQINLKTTNGFQGKPSKAKRRAARNRTETKPSETTPLQSYQRNRRQLHRAVQHDFSQLLHETQSRPWTKQRGERSEFGNIVVRASFVWRGGVVGFSKKPRIGQPPTVNFGRMSRPVAAPFTVLLLLLTFIQISYATTACTFMNECNGHGDCDSATRTCSCYAGWGAPTDVSLYKAADCSLRT